MSNPIGFLGVGIILLGCDSLSRTGAEPDRKTVESTYIQERNLECGKHSAGIKAKLDRGGPYVRQTLERVYYSPGLGTCVALIYSVRPESVGGTSDGNQTVELIDVLTERALWRQEYPLIGTGSKTHDEMIAEAYKKLYELGWQEK